jgi:DMSO reductase anchor subunit
VTRSRLRLGEYLAALGAAALLVALFALNWYCNPTVAGWHAIPTLRWFLLVSAVLGLALVVTQAVMRGPAMAVTLDLLAMLVAGLTTILIAIRLITTGATVWTGAWVGVGAAALTALGAFSALRTEQGWTPGRDREIEQIELSDDAQRGEEDA